MQLAAVQQVLAMNVADASRVHSTAYARTKGRHRARIARECQEKRRASNVKPADAMWRLAVRRFAATRAALPSTSRVCTP
jgi:hypothetical protein